MLLEIQSILVMLIGAVCFEAVRCLLLRYYVYHSMIAFDNKIVIQYLIIIAVFFRPVSVVFQSEATNVVFLWCAGITFS